MKSCECTFFHVDNLFLFFLRSENFFANSELCSSSKIGVIFCPISEIGFIVGLIGNFCSPTCDRVKVETKGRVRFGKVRLEKIG